MKYLVFISFLLIGCSSSKTQRSTEVDENGVPKWVSEPDSACKSTEVCGLGEGTGLQTASANARLEVAKYFGTKIVSKFQVTTTSDNQTTDETVNEDLQEITNQLLDGVKIKKRFDGQTAVHVLAVLDRNVASRKIRNKIKDLDEKMELDYRNKSLSGLFRLKRFYNQRASLNLRYELFKGNRIPEKVTFRNIVNLQKDLSQNKLISVAINGDEGNKLTSLLKQSLTGLGFRVVDGESEFTLRGRYSSKESYLKVSGFKKYEFILNLTCLNDSKQEIGALAYNNFFTGRDFKQSEEQALKDISNYLKENIDKLQF